MIIWYVVVSLENCTVLLYQMPTVVSYFNPLTHIGRVTHICISVNIIGSDNSLSPDWCQAIVWTNAVRLLIGPCGTNSIELFIKIQQFSFFKKMLLKMLSGKWRPFCLGLNVWNGNNAAFVHSHIAVTWVSRHFILLVTWLIVQKHVQSNNKETMQAPH